MRATAAGARPLLEVRDLVQQFRVPPGGGFEHPMMTAVAGVSFELRGGETLAIVGESGSGKSTLARCILQIQRPTSGSVVFEGQDLTQLRGKRLRASRRRMQMVFQDPFRSLDPTWRVSEIVAEPLVAYGVGDRREMRRKVCQVLDMVGLSNSIHGRRRPAELSGGQCQRVAIARALALDPALIICDEAVSSLDVLIQAHVLNLLARLRVELGLAYLFISHDLALVRHVADRVAVLHAGQLCEIGAVDSVYGEPMHPYTASMIFSIPRARPLSAARKWLVNGIRSGVGLTMGSRTGCRLRGGCPLAKERCALETPRLREVGNDHWVACHYPERAWDARPAERASCV